MAKDRGPMGSSMGNLYGRPCLFYYVSLLQKPFLPRRLQSLRRACRSEREGNLPVITRIFALSDLAG